MGGRRAINEDEYLKLRFFTKMFAYAKDVIGEQELEILGKFVLNPTYIGVAQDMGIKKERVKQIVQLALDLMGLDT